MQNFVQPVRAATSNYILNKSNTSSASEWLTFLDTPVYIHWPTIYKALKDSVIKYNESTRRILAAWENEKLLPIPHGEDGDELPSLVRLNERFPDNVKVYCSTFGEYVELRKNFGREDIGGFILDEI